MSVRDFPLRPQGAPPDSVPYQNWLDTLGQRQNIDLLQELTSVASGDEVAIFDVSETGNNKTKKATVTNLLASAGDVDGPASSTDNAIALFNGTTGKIIKDSATLISALMAYADTRFKVGSFTNDLSAASGNQAVTGVGFQPKAVIMSASIVGGNKWGSIGLASSASAYNCFEFDFSNSFVFIQPSFLTIVRTASGNYKTSVLASFDVDGFTVTFTKTGTPTGTQTINYLALR